MVVQALRLQVPSFVGPAARRVIEPEAGRKVHDQPGRLKLLPALRRRSQVFSHV